MGACYSKNTPGTRAGSESKTSKQKHRSSDRNKKQNAEELLPEKIPLQTDEKSDSPNGRTSRSFSYDIVPDISYVKHLDHSIAPSDSGIESIGTWQDDAQGSTRIKQFDSELLKHSEQWSLSFCQNCGHYKLQGHNVLTDSNGLCCADQAELSAGSSELLAHGFPANERTLTIRNAESDSSVKVIIDSAKYNAIGGSIMMNNLLQNKYNAIGGSIMMNNLLQNKTSSFQLKSGLDMSNSVVRDRHLIPSLRSAKRSSRAGSQNKLFDSSLEEINEAKAPLAQHDPLDRPVNDTLDDRISKQQALLKDISFTAETICTCDFYADYQKKCAGVSEENNHAVKSNIHDIKVEEKDKFNHRETKSSSLSRKGSITYHSEIKTEEAAAKLSSPIVSTPIKKPTEINTTNRRSSLSESTSGVCTQQTESLRTDVQQGSLLLGSVDDVLDDSSGECGTEDDMASIDMDNISRLTSQSSSSSRQLNASSEHAISPCDSNLAASDDGEDCVVIPEETYHQLQTDLSALRQQLLCLSSLIEQPEGGDQNFDSMADISY